MPAHDWILQRTGPDITTIPPGFVDPSAWPSLSKLEENHGNPHLGSGADAANTWDRSPLLDKALGCTAR